MGRKSGSGHGDANHHFSREREGHGLQGQRGRSGAEAGNAEHGGRGSENGDNLESEGETEATGVGEGSPNGRTTDAPSFSSLFFLSLSLSLARCQLRFKRMGRKKRPFYRLVAIDSRRKREGLALEELGYYNPLTKETHLNAESIQKWIKDGAEPSDTVASLLKKAMPSVVQK